MLTEMNMAMIILLGLASFRLTRLFVYDKIMDFVRAPFMDEETEVEEDGSETVYLIPKGSGVKKWIGSLLLCYWCTGIWMSGFLIVLLLYFPVVGEPLILLLSVAAIGSIIETIIGKIIGG